MIRYRLYEIMESKGISIRELSRKSGVSRSQIERIRDEKSKPSLETLEPLAKALGVALTDLFRCEE